MITLVLFAIATAGSGPFQSDQQIARLRFSEGVVISVGGYEVSIESSSFREDVHKIARSPEGWVTIDGRTRYGVGGQLPANSVSKIVGTFGGKSLKFDDDFGKHIYNVHLSAGAFSRREASSAAITDDGLVVTIAGGDGGTAYWCVLHIRADGKHSRQFLTH